MYDYVDPETKKAELEIWEKAGEAAAEAAVTGYKAIENGTVGTYKAIENGVVGAYKAIENGVVGTYQKVEDAFVQAFLTKEAGTEASEEPKK